MSDRFIRMCQEYVGLACNFQVNPNSCGNPTHYESYIRYDAISDQNNGRGTTHLLIDLDEKGKDKQIMGFITLRATSLTEDDQCGTILGHSALEIAELAVSKDYERCGVGSKLVGISLLMAENLNKEQIGISHVVLCADKSAVGFYSKLDPPFKPVREYYEIPREGWNDGCTPMFLKLPERNL